MRYFILKAVVFAVVLGTFSGCQSLSIKDSWPWSRDTVKESKYVSPQSMAAIWTPDVLTHPDQPPTRGFGARIYFYGEANQPVPVEGQLVVYAYDDSERLQGPSRMPSRKFVFTNEQFTRHFGKSELGASYSIWLPWDAAGGDQREISLVPVFTATSGKVVMGQQSALVLPGRKGDAITPPNTVQVTRWNRPEPAVRQASHWESTSQPAVAHGSAEQPITAPKRMQTTTFAMTESLSRRLTAAAQQEATRPISVPNMQPAPHLPVVPQPNVEPVTPPTAPVGRAPSPPRVSPMRNW